jgi:hypothetical protein
MVFASAAARTTALSGVLAEGMISYRTDSHILEYYDGTSWSSVSTSIPTSYGFSAGKNKVINGDFGVWQRGTSIAVAASTVAYVADRWNTNTGTNQATTISRQSTSDTTNLPNIQYCARFQRNSGQTGTGLYFLSQSLETATSIPFAGKTVTFSFYARAGANYSPTSNALGVYIYTGTGTDQNVLVSYTGQANTNTSVTLTTTWQRFTFTTTIPSNATEISTLFGFTPTGTASTNDYFEVTGVQLEAGSTATAFQTATGTVQGELAACQRYYYRATNVATAGSNYFIMGTSTTTSIMDFAFQLPVTLRVKAASIDYANLAVYGNRTATSYSSGTWTLQNPDTAEVAVARYTHGTAIFNAGADSGWLTSNTAATNYIGFSAEL